MQDYQSLIRTTIEFCVELQDCYFLFYDLFLLFEEVHMEKLFLQELEPLIIAGRFQEWILPADIIQNHIVNLYRTHCSDHPETLEKVMINLILYACPQSVIQEMISYCQSNYL